MEVTQALQEVSLFQRELKIENLSKRLIKRLDYSYKRIVLNHSYTRATITKLRD